MGHKDYPAYGGRGIKMAEEWSRPWGFYQFLEDMGHCPPGHSIDRIDGTKGYSKENCRWATPLEQARNLYTNIWIEANDRRMLLVEWAEELGVRAATLRGRLDLGWDPERVVNTPVRQYTKKAG